jgi:glutamyl-tRNA reductase
MKLLVTGLNHRTAPVEVREKLAFDGPKLEDGLDTLLRIPDVEGGVILSTCNRVEMYNYVRDKEKAIHFIKKFLSQFHSIDEEALEGSLYFYSDREAVRHVFRVASSLDSMVVGEPQILGQLKDSFHYALSRKATGILLNKLLKKAISIAKRVRTETRIAENAVSISYAAVELAKKIFADLSEKSFMLLGAGEMAELAVRHLLNNGVRNVTVSNRTFERGVELAREFGGRTIRFEVFKDELLHTDIIICSTGAPTYILFKPDVQKVMKMRKNRSVFIIDISVPRNIDPEINSIDNVYLYSVDDLQEVIDSNILERRKEAEKAEEIVEEEVEKFLEWEKSLNSVPTIVALRNKAEEIRHSELEKLMSKLQGLDDDQKKAIDYTLAAVINKLLHPPTVALKDSAEDSDVLIATIKRLYGLEEKNDEE